MTSITQQIPNYVGGISQQPDELKVPGQVRTAKNVIPDVTHGLLKRPGGRLIGSALSAYTTDSKWFHYYRDENEQYIGQINQDGEIKMWDCATGAEKAVTNNLPTTTAYCTYSRTSAGLVSVTWRPTGTDYAGASAEHPFKVGEIIKADFITGGANDGNYEIVADNHGGNYTVFKFYDGGSSVISGSFHVQIKSNYLYNLTDSDIQTLTLNDYTYLTNRNKPVSMLDNAATVNPARPPEAFIELKKVAYASQYSVNIFDTTTTTEVKTATRIKVASSSLDSDSTCPNVGTEILKVGTDGQDLTNVKQKIKVSLVTIGQTSAVNFFEDDTTRSYSLIYVPPAWVVNTYYQTGDLVQGESDNSRIYKRTGSAITSSGTVPVHDSGETDGWTAITTTTYTANSDVSSTQLYGGQACIEIADSRKIDSKADLDLTVAAWSTGNGAHFPFEIDSTTWDGMYATLTYVWKNNGDYSDHISRIIFRRTNGTNHTIGGNNVSSADDGALSTSNGTLAISRIGWGGHNVLPAGRADLYFRLTNTGQAVPDATGDNYSCSYTTTVDLLHGGSGWEPGDKIQIRMKGGVYVLEVEETSISKVQANLGLIRPAPTSFDTKTTVTAESILGALQTDIVAANSTWDAWPSSGETKDSVGVKLIGNGIYIRRDVATNFNISTPVGELLNVLTDSVEDVADLPKQCRHGYVVRINNSEAEEDDYYVKFIGKLKTGGTEGDDNDYLDGNGVWEECPEPGVKTTLDAATLPVQLVRQADGTFKVSQIAWENRLVGDTTTVPEPSFIGKTVNKMLFFRNRLVLLSDENVIMSRPGDFYNFWPKSAITYTASDNIDISCSSEYPAIVYDGLQVNSGLVLFTKNQQFMLTTDSDILSPLTAKINSLSSYNFNFETNPVSLGTTVAFLDNAGKYTRFFEMTAVLREGEPNVLEQSKNISKLFPNNINLIANSRENATIFFATKGTNKLYGFRYYQTGERRVQQAWFEWELSGTIEHIAMLDDALYAVVKNTGYTMQKFSLKLDDNSHTIVEDETYRVHLDNSKSFAYTNLTYVADGDYTKFDHTAADFSGSGQLYAVAVSTSTDKEFNGLVSKVTTFDDNGTTKVKIPSNWTTSTASQAFNVVLGYAFDMEIEFPTLYVTEQVGERFKSDIQSSLVLHRIKMSLGPTGVYDTTLKRIGKPDYTETFESILADVYTANTVGIDKEQVVTLPVYEKNTNLTFTLKSTHPTPSTLYSINWEGDYSKRYYKRV